MLTPNQIKNHVFTSVKGMYQINEVDGFMGQITESYEQMFKENRELLEKLEMLARRLEEYRQDEDKIKDALIVAQKTASQINIESEKKASLTLSDANAKAEETLSSAKWESEAMLSDAKSTSQSTLANAEATANEVIDGAKVLADNVISHAKSSSKEIIANAKVEVEMNQTILNELKAAAATFKADLLEKYHNHIEVINTIPDTVSKDFESGIQNWIAAQTEQEIVEEAEEEADMSELSQESEAELPPVAQEPEAVPQVETAAYEAPEIAAPIPVVEPEQSYADDVLPGDLELASNEPMMDEPADHAGRPRIDEALKFGEDYDISNDVDEYGEEEEDEERGFKGFFRRKK